MHRTHCRSDWTDSSCCGATHALLAAVHRTHGGLGGPRAFRSERPPGRYVMQVGSLRARATVMAIDGSGCLRPPQQPAGCKKPAREQRGCFSGWQARAPEPRTNVRFAEGRALWALRPGTLARETCLASSAFGGFAHGCALACGCWQGEKRWRSHHGLLAG